MKISLVAMSGVRAASEELNRAGLTMPGVLERGAVVASLPTLSLLTLAALCPPGVEIEYHEIPDLSKRSEKGVDGDLVAIASQSAQIDDAYAVADACRAQGSTVVMGGLHVSALPHEALEHCDAVVIGEAEALWPGLVEDFRIGRLLPVYKSTAGAEFSLADAPPPRYDLLDPAKYNRLLVQTTRGCPHRCDFCASSIRLTERFKTKPPERVVEEIRRIKAIWPRPFIEMADDNTFANREYGRRLCEALAPEGVRWFTESDISVAEDPILLDLIRRAGCRQVLVGLESPHPAGLDGIETRRNWKLLQFPRYAASIRAIQSRGIAVNGCFILGGDADTPETFDAVYDFAQRAGLYDVQITVLTPFPGTPLHDRLAAEGRLLRPGDWRSCTLFDVNFAPRNMSPAELQSGLLSLALRLYHPDAVAERRERFLEQVRAGASEASLEDWT